MPPEVFRWDRRGFRKYDRPGSDPALGGGFGGGGPTRWRDQHHPQPPPPSHPYHHHQHRLYSGFRSRPLPPGLGKQGGRDMYQEESSHGFPPFGSRFSDRISDDVNFRPPGYYSDGRYFRNSREIRGSFSQRVLKGHSREPAASPRGPVRVINDVNKQSSVENVKTYNNGSNNNNRSSNNFSHPQPDAVNLSDQSQSLKEMHDKNGGNTDGLACKGQKLEKENSLGSIDWKSLKWPRSGSLSSRGSGFSISSISKSMGTDSNDAVAAMPILSPSGDAAACPMSAATASSDDTSSRKKPRLRWGEGLKKYEKKKVEGPEDGTTRNGFVISDSDTETVLSNPTNLADKSPKAAVLLDCASPATPSSVACSSSPGVQEKQSIKAVSVDHDMAKLSSSPSILPQMQCEGPTFNLENFELTSIANLSSSISELLRSDYTNSMDTGFVQTTAMNKLLLWKVDVLKALEMTESEIDSLETEFRSSISEGGSSFPHPAASFMLPGDKILENIPEALDYENTGMKDEDIGNPESATSKFVKMSSVNDFCPSDTANQIEGYLNSDVNNSENLEVNCLDEETKGYVDDSEPILSSNYLTLASSSNSCRDREDIYNLILATNRDSADRASEVLNKLLPANQCHSDISTATSVSYLPNDCMVMKKKFLRRKQFIQFNEKVAILKFKVSHHFWKENQLHSARRVRMNSHKLDLCRPEYFGYQKHHSYRSRFSSPVFADGNPSRVPTEVIEYVRRLLSNFEVKPYRNILKMPVLILDKKDKFMSRFISSNGLVEDPIAVEKERSMINIWTSEEREIFVDKLATFGKDFSKIASFLDHKSTADCIEFYYKNQKSEYFEKTKMKTGFPKQRKARSSSTYMVASVKRWNCESNAASLDILSAASAVAASVDDSMEIQQKCTSRFFPGSSGFRESRGDVDSLQRSNSLNIYETDRETMAVDVLAGICGSLSSEAMSSCITSSVDPAEIYEEVYDSCLDESCEEVDPTDWTDEEKSFFIQALSSHGKNFAMISRCIRTRSTYECKVFFSKARKCLGLDMIQPRPGNDVSGDINGGGSDDTEEACVVESGSIICSERSGCEMVENLISPDLKTSYESDTVGMSTLKPNLNECEENNGRGFDDLVDAENPGPDQCQEKDKADLDFDVDANANEQGADGGTVVVSSDTKSSWVIEEADNHVQSNRLGETENAASIEVSDGHRRPDVTSHPCADARSYPQLDITLECQKKTSNDVASSAALANAISDVQCQKIAQTCQHLSCHSFSDRVESSKILGDFKASMLTAKKENEDINCKTAVSLQSDVKIDGNFPLDGSSGFSLQKCSSSRYKNSPEAPIQTMNTCRKGGVKLFGQILISSQEKQNSCVPANDKKNPHHKSGKQPFSRDGINSAQAKFDWDGYQSSENIPRSWDTNKLQNAFPSLPDSTILFYQNPAALTNNALPSDKLKQPLLHPVVKSSECELSGISFFPTQELSSSNRVADYEVPRDSEVQPFPIDLEMQRVKGFDVMSGTQQPKKGMGGINDVGCQYAGVSDPVEAIKMHYAKAEQLCPDSEHHQSQ